MSGIPGGTDGGFIAEKSIGTNGNPTSKIADFDRIMRGGMGETVDVALMKFCYVDVTANTDVSSLFASYRDNLAGLQKDFPDVTFLHTTVPLTTDSSADDAEREKLNGLMRGSYGGRVFDLAAAESTTPQGTKVSGLYTGYASDSGHLEPGRVRGGCIGLPRGDRAGVLLRAGKPRLPDPHAVLGLEVERSPSSRRTRHTTRPCSGRSR